jgi:hypothetical protein
MVDLNQTGSSDSLEALKTKEGTMQRLVVLSVSVAVMTWSASAIADSPQLMGDYGFTGSATCVNSPAGPGSGAPLFELLAPTSQESFAVDGVRTFNGDGTGTVTGTSMGVEFKDTLTLANGNAATFSYSFTYTVNGDGTWTSSVLGAVTGHVTAGPRSGQNFGIFNFPILTGRISKNAMTLTAATRTPTVERVEYSAPPNPVWRICHRSRVFISQ